MKVFLIWEGHEMPIPETRRGYDPSPTSKTVTEFNTVPFLKSGKDENEAAMKVVRETRRLSKLAICEVSLIDFAAGLDDTEPEPQAGSLLTRGEDAAQADSPA